MGRRIKTCYISAPIGANLSILRNALSTRGVHVLVPDEMTYGTSIGAEVKYLIAQADLVIGVLTRERRSQWVLFELGQAAALNKQVVLFTPPKAEAVFADLQRILTLRVSLRNRDAIEFALDQLLAAPERPAKVEHPQKVEGKPLGGSADKILLELHDALASKNYRRFEEIVASAIRSSGVDAIAEGLEGDRGFDLAIWSDTLQPLVGNPLLIEIKMSLCDRNQIRSIFKQCAKAANAAGAKWSLLIYGEAPDKDVSALNIAAAPTVLALSIDELIQEMRGRTFVDVVRNARNSRVHGEGR